MRHAKAYRKLSRQRSHYRSLMRNLASALMKSERIKTTMAKAKELRGFVDRLISLGKKGGVPHRRRVLALLGNRKEMVSKIFNVFSLSSCLFTSSRVYFFLKSFKKPRASSE